MAEYQNDAAVELSPDWTGEWLEIHEDLIQAVIVDLLRDMDAGEYL